MPKWQAALGGGVAAVFMALIRSTPRSAAITPAGALAPISRREKDPHDQRHRGRLVPEWQAALGIGGRVVHGTNSLDARSPRRSRPLEPWRQFLGAKRSARPTPPGRLMPKWQAALGIGRRRVHGSNFLDAATIDRAGVLAPNFSARAQDKRADKWLSQLLAAIFGTNAPGADPDSTGLSASLTTARRGITDPNRNDRRS